MNEARTGLRERTRRAIQRDIAETSERLFVERGYDATTMAHIAEAVGMSRRTLYRYFATREEIVLGKLDLVAEDLLATLRSRPAGEPLWVSMRHSFDLLIAYFDEPRKVEFAEPMQRVIFGTPDLLARYLEKLERVQGAAEQVVRERAAAAGRAWADDDPTPRAVVAAALGCLLAAQHAWLAGGATKSFADLVDQAMGAVEPRA
ncbi:TetR family transcriptional regulator [Promicromonospora sp. MEB111]|uniref:TetR/AcrR family transcriptional regulator n=1 Tax=unclassified Promicromonospora TaxID=2647929 RepID=UPI00254EA232|nr:TetR family transcriptional regulator [Promicromonospora sp. MEB111]